MEINTTLEQFSAQVQSLGLPPDTPIRVILDELQKTPDAKSGRTVAKNRLRNEALAYVGNHPVFPLHWSQNKLSRDEMNER